jgi:hypothetical protein
VFTHRAQRQCVQTQIYFNKVCPSYSAFTRPNIHIEANGTMYESKIQAQPKPTKTNPFRVWVTELAASGERKKSKCSINVQLNKIDDIVSGSSFSSPNDAPTVYGRVVDGCVHQGKGRYGKQRHSKSRHVIVTPLTQPTTEISKIQHFQCYSNIGAVLKC